MLGWLCVGLDLVPAIVTLLLHKGLATIPMLPKWLSLNVISGIIFTGCSYYMCGLNICTYQYWGVCRLRRDFLTQEPFEGGRSQRWRHYDQQGEQHTKNSEHLPLARHK